MEKGDGDSVEKTKEKIRRKTFNNEFEFKN